MHSGAKLLRKTLTGTERATEHKSRKSKSLVRPDKKVSNSKLNILELFLTFHCCFQTLAGIRLVETMKHYVPIVPPDSSGRPVFDIGACVPPKPENGALQRRLKQLDSDSDSGGPRLRMDLGTVGPPSGSDDPQPSRGTLISSMFFARKGGLL